MRAAEARRLCVGGTWRKVQAQVFAEESHCWLCGGWVDPTLHYNDKWARSVDHVIPVTVRPDLATVRSNLRLAHRECNRRRSDGPAVAGLRAERAASRQWRATGEGRG